MTGVAQTSTIRLVTALEVPEPDADEALLLGALRAAGLDARLAAWDDPGVDWRGGLSIIRSTWDYHRRHGEFLAWAVRAAGEGTLWNPLEVVRWNTHKSYLADLAAAGVPTVPTRLVERGARARLADLGWDRVVVKPAVSGGSRETHRFERASFAEGDLELARLAADEDVLIQPYLESVEGHGERALVWIDGELTHAVRKSPRFAADPEQVSEALPIAGDERALARAALACSPRADLLYGRVDMARDAAGRPVVMELELVEPSLFLAHSPAALARFVAAISARAGR